MFSIARVTVFAASLAALAALAGGEEAVSEVKGTLVPAEPPSAELRQYLDLVAARTQPPFQVAQADPTADGRQVIQFNLEDAPKPASEPTNPIFDQYVSLDFKNADIQNVIRMISQRTGLNILMNPDDVQGLITLSLDNVRLKDALDSILRTNKLAFIMTNGNIMRIVPQSQVGRSAVEVTTEVIELNWRNAVDIENTFKDFITPVYGSMKANEEAQALIITDVPPNIEKIKELIAQIDRPDRQVVIEARLVDIQVGASRSLTNQWSATKLNNNRPLFGADSDGVPFNLDLNNPAIRNGLDPITGNPLGRLAGVEPVQVEGFGFNGGVGELKFGSVIGIFGNDYLIDATLRALEERDEVEILANPRVTTLNNVPASIEIIERIPYVTQSLSSGGGISSTVQFRDAGIRINVRPIITPNGFVRLDMELHQMIFRGRAEPLPLSPPLIDERNSDSTVIVQDANTVVLGGLRNQRSVSSINGVPWLHRIPLIGWAFKDSRKEREKTDLVLMVTPRIVEEASVTDVEKEHYDRIDTKWNLPDYYFDDVSDKSDQIPAGPKSD